MRAAILFLVFALIFLPQANGRRENNKNKRNTVAAGNISECLEKTRSTHRVLRGMVNEGKWCYVNSALQSLLNNPKLFDFLSRLSLCKLSLKDAPLTESLSMVAAELTTNRPTSTVLHSSAINIAQAHKAITVLRGTKFTPKGTPDDAHDVYEFVLRRLNEEILNRTGSSPIFFDQFRGTLRNELSVGEKLSSTVEEFLTIRLNALSPNTHSVMDAINEFTFPEVIDNFGGHGIDATKRVAFQNLPPVLVLYLNFATYSQGTEKKILKEISYPLELEIPESATVAGFTGGRRYILDSVVHHHGKETATGHFSGSIRFNNKWYLVDSAKKIEQRAPPLKVIGNQIPYLLFYSRVDN